MVKSRFTCTFTHTCYFYSGSTIHIYPLISISRTTQKYSTPNPGENSQKYFCFPYEINAQVILLLPLAILSQEMSALKKRRKKKKNIYIRGNKKGQVPGTSERKEKVRREVKMDKCPTVELGVQDTHLREKKKKSISFSSQNFKKQERYVSPQKTKSRIRLSPLLSPLSPYTIHWPHMHILI